MKKKPVILGIETSCDETAASIIQENNDGSIKILSNIVSSQFDIHKEFGGVVPELAARSHAEKIDLITNKAILESGLNLKDIDAVAATAGLRTTIASLQEGGITTQEGLVNVHPQEAIVPIEELGGMIADAMKPVVEETQNLRQDMNGYFGFGGSAVNGISKGVVTGIQNA